MSRPLHSHQEPQRGIRPRAVLSLCPLWNSVESEGAQAARVFTNQATSGLTDRPVTRSRSVQVVTSASSSHDVLQRLQVPNFYA